VQVLEHEDLIQGERREDAIDADLDRLHLRLGGPVDRNARHAHAVHRAAGGELAAPLPSDFDPPAHVGMRGSGGFSLSPFIR
jgi:hypothetical protein